MSRKRFGILTGILVAVALLIHLFSTGSGRVERWYSNGIYPRVAAFFRVIFGWLPFSIGDILYGLAALWLVWRLVKGVRALVKRQVTRESLLNSGKRTVIILLGVYIIFNAFWGINYNREGIYRQVGVPLDTFSYAELHDVSFMLTDKLNLTKSFLIRNKVTYPSNRDLFAKVKAAYEKTVKVYPFLGYTHVSIKPSIWSWVGNYTGFTGYYNPFTGEAQVNTLVPGLLQPFVACHEVGHQLGYAKENEASAVGYIAALHSGDSLLLYSTYFELFNAARRELLLRSYLKGDTTMRQQLSERLIPEVKADIREVAAFFSRHKNPVEPFVRQGYALYLRNNNQPSGLRSYDEVTAFLIAWYRRFGKI